MPSVLKREPAPLGRDPCPEPVVVRVDERARVALAVDDAKVNRIRTRPKSVRFGQTFVRPGTVPRRGSLAPVPVAAGVHPARHDATTRVRLVDEFASRDSRVDGVGVLGVPALERSAKAMRIASTDAWSQVMQCGGGPPGSAASGLSASNAACRGWAAGAPTRASSLYVCDIGSDRWRARRDLRASHAAALARRERSLRDGPAVEPSLRRAPRRVGTWRRAGGWRTPRPRTARGTFRLRRRRACTSRRLLGAGAPACARAPR